MKLKRLARSWGEEVVIGEDARVARVYASTKKVTVDLSQVQDETWDRFVKVQAKNPGCTEIELPPETDVEAIIHLVVEGLMADGTDAAMFVSEDTYKAAMFRCVFADPVHGYVWGDRHGWVHSDEVEVYPCFSRPSSSAARWAWARIPRPAARPPASG